MRPPEFWKADARGRDAAHMLRMLLTPISWVYSAAGAQRWRATKPRHAPAPVVCIGNFTLGGAGKTPVTRAVRAILGEHAHTLSRGYGGRIAGPLRVTPDMDAREVGDEPLLHAADGPAWISRDRYAGALAAANAGARAIIMDDGFQNPRLAKDLSIVVIDAGFGVGNGQVFPAGPLREPLRTALPRADALVVLGARREDDEMEWIDAFTKPVLHAALEPAGTAPAGKLLAFAGLGRPEKFFDTLVAVGADVEDCVPYPDHHPYSDDDLAFLTTMAEERGARLITTEKDAVRLSPQWRTRVAVLPVEARFADMAALQALLAPIQLRMNQAHG